MYLFNFVGQIRIWIKKSFTIYVHKCKRLLYSSNIMVDISYLASILLNMYVLKTLLSFLGCPAGYYGANCSFMCFKPYYGTGCVTKCECSPCHHVYGCKLTTKGNKIKNTHALK